MLEYWIVTVILIIISAVLYTYRSRTTKPYSIMDQAMSDLGVLSCGGDTCPLASYEICSPMAHEMNIIFILTGILTATGAVLLHRFWGSSKLTVGATILILGLPAGLMQRLLYFSVWFWMDVTAIILWRKS